jgi:hypothetical protein
MMQLARRSLLCRAAVLLAILIAPSSAPRADEAAGEKTIVFVCLHGVVNSQMAAAYFNKAARERGLPFTAVSRGIDLYQSIPVRIQDGLALDGLEPANAPLALTAEEAGRVSDALRSIRSRMTTRETPASPTGPAFPWASTTMRRHATRSSGASMRSSPHSGSKVRSASPQNSPWKRPEKT